MISLSTRAVSVVLALFAASSAAAQQLAVTPYDKTGIYSVGKIVGWTVAVAEGEHAAPGEYKYVVKENGQRVIKQGSLDLARGPGKIETSLAEPGMVRVEIRPPAGTKQFGNMHTGGDGIVALGAAVDPTKIKPVMPRPADFDSFWQAKIALLDRVPVNATVMQTPGGV